MKRNHLKGLLSMLLSLVSLYGQAQELLISTKGIS